MSDRFAYRALITETLPYEVPVIFSNDRFFAAVQSAHNSNAPLLKKIISMEIQQYTIPYNYEIRKNAETSTSLSIVHPLAQIALAEFVDTYSGVITHHCNFSEISLRRPTSVSPVKAVMEQGPTLSNFKEGSVEREVYEKSLPTFTSYFSYRKFNLLARFIDSREFIRHEKRFRFLRTLDVTKCFFNIYTHSLTWAVKSKEFSKDNANKFSFEGRFDKLMQQSNYNETNGIVVGPEISRIFAEIIFQDVDEKLLSVLKNCGLQHNIDFVARRYVDDYFIFADKIELLDKIEIILGNELEKYKLFFNKNKILSYSRPFVSNLSMARQAVEALLSDLLDQLQNARDDIDDFRRVARLVSDVSRQLRAVTRKNDIEFSNLSGRIFSILIRFSTRLMARIKSTPRGSDLSDAHLKVITSVLDLAFYICGVDLRVRTTYSLCQLLTVLTRVPKSYPQIARDQVEFIIHDEISQLLGLSMRSGALESNRDSVEVYNLLICGSIYAGEDFLSDSNAAQALRVLSNEDNMTYFKYITLKFCYRRDLPLYQNELDTLNKWAISQITDIKDVARKAQKYLLFCDLLSADDISESDKLSLYKVIFSGNHSKAEVSHQTRVLGFVDWSGLSIAHTLKRKRLRPVYD